MARGNPWQVRRFAQLRVLAPQHIIRKQLCLDVFPLQTPGFGTGGTFSVIGFLQFSLCLGHDFLRKKAALAAGFGTSSPPAVRRRAGSVTRATSLWNAVEYLLGVLNRQFVESPFCQKSMCSVVRLFWSLFLNHRLQSLPPFELFWCERCFLTRA